MIFSHKKKNRRFRPMMRLRRPHHPQSRGGSVAPDSTFRHVSLSLHFAGRRIQPRQQYLQPSKRPSPRFWKEKQHTSASRYQIRTRGSGYRPTKGTKSIWRSCMRILRSSPRPMKSYGLPSQAAVLSKRHDEYSGRPLDPVEIPQKPDVQSKAEPPMMK